MRVERPSTIWNMTGVEIVPAVLAELAKHPNGIGLEETAHVVGPR